MRWLRVSLLSTCLISLTAIAAEPEMGPTPVSYSYVYPPADPYGPGGYVVTPEIISRVGEILAAIDRPQLRTELAQQWLQFSRQTIAKEQEFRNAWLDLQRQQLRQQQEADRLRREVVQLQMRIEELRAENLRLQQENLQAQLKLSQAPGSQNTR